MPLMYSMERDKYEQAGELINRALEQDPDNAMILAWAAHWQVYHVGQGWSSDPGQAFATAQRFAMPFEAAGLATNSETPTKSGIRSIDVL